MTNTSRNFNKILAIILMAFSVLALSSCGMFSNDGMGFYEDKEGSTSTNRTSTQLTISASSNSDATAVNSPAGTYIWKQAFLESNFSQKAAYVAETAVIVINNDNRGMINDFIPCRLNNNELIIEYALGDAGNSKTSGTLKITTSNGKKHVEGTVKTSNSDGFYVIERWVMDEN